MVRDAEANAVEDRRMKELAESRGRGRVYRPFSGRLFCVLAALRGQDATKVAKNHARRTAV